MMAKATMPRWRPVSDGSSCRALGNAKIRKPMSFHFTSFQMGGLPVRGRSGSNPRWLHAPELETPKRRQNSGIHKKFQTPLTTSVYPCYSMFRGSGAMKYSELTKILLDCGCRVCREGANHTIWTNPKTGEKFTVSRHKTQEVPKGTLKSIMRSAGLE